MRELLILAVLYQGLFALSPPVCTNISGQAAADEVTYLINKLHHHGYKFKLDSFTEEQVSRTENRFNKIVYKHPVCVYLYVINVNIK